ELNSSQHENKHERHHDGDFHQHSTASIATEISCGHRWLSSPFDCAFRIRGGNNRSSQPQYIQKSQRGIVEFGGPRHSVDGCTTISAQSVLFDGTVDFGALKLHHC